MLSTKKYTMRNFYIRFVILIMLSSCNLINKEAQEARRMTLEWHNREIVLPAKLSCQTRGVDTIYSNLVTKKYKIFTYIDTLGCTSCKFGAMEWKQLIHEIDTLSDEVAFLFYAHLKDYEDFETYLEINKFKYPIFYDYDGVCNLKNNLPNQVYFQTFLLDENNKVLLIGKPKPDSKLWDLYKKIITRQY